MVKRGTSSSASTATATATAGCQSTSPTPRGNSIVLLVAVLCCSSQCRGACGWSFTIDQPEDVICTLADGTETHGLDGPTIGTLGGVPNLRSGPPDGVCRAKLAAPAPISSVTMEYRYLTGCKSRPKTTPYLHSPSFRLRRCTYSWRRWFRGIY